MTRDTPPAGPAAPTVPAGQAAATGAVASAPQAGPAAPAVAASAEDAVASASVTAQTTPPSAGKPAARAGVPPQAAPASAGKPAARAGVPPQAAPVRRAASARRARSYAAAATVLAQRDPVMARLVADAGPPRVRPPAETHLAALVRAIVYQQLAGRAAAAIHGRLIGALGGEVTAQGLLSLPAEALRSAGLSGSKAASLRDLAAKVLDGTVVLDPAGLRAESDDEVAARLSAVRGIGKWTAEMFLMFQLRRLDVWPTGDLGVRKGFGLAWAIPTPTPKQLEPLGEPYRPYRSVVAWYCWRAAELYAGAADSALTR